MSRYPPTLTVSESSQGMLMKPATNGKQCYIGMDGTQSLYGVALAKRVYNKSLCSYSITSKGIICNTQTIISISERNKISRITAYLVRKQLLALWNCLPPPGKLSCEQFYTPLVSIYLFRPDVICTSLNRVPISSTNAYSVPCFHLHKWWIFKYQRSFDF